MGVFLGTIIAEFIAGMGVWYFTEGGRNNTQQSNSQIVNINNYYYFNPSRPSDFSGSSGGIGEIKPETFFLIGFFFLMVTAIIVVGVVYYYVQWLNLILTISFWGTIGLSVIGGLILIAGIYYNRKNNDVSVIQIAIFCLVLCAVFGGLIWLIYAPPFAPDEYSEVFNRLYPLDSEEYKAVQFEIFFDFRVGLRFMFLQAAGVIPMFLSMICVLVIQGLATVSMLSKKNFSVPLILFYLAPALAFISSILLGIAEPLIRSSS